MKIFLDTADTSAIEKAYTTGIIDGITTNPTLIRKSGRDPEEVYQELIDLVNVNVTLIFSPAQAILAAKSGAKYVSPFVGRVDDNSFVGMDLIEQISDIYTIQNVNKTEILSASIRDVKSVSDSFASGAHVVTMPPTVFEKMYNHVLTDKGLYLFDMDWAQVKR